MFKISKFLERPKIFKSYIRKLLINLIIIKKKGFFLIKKKYNGETIERMMNSSIGKIKSTDRMADCSIALVSRVADALGTGIIRTAGSVRITNINFETRDFCFRRENVEKIVGGIIETYRSVDPHKNSFAT